MAKEPKWTEDENRRLAIAFEAVNAGTVTVESIRGQFGNRSWGAIYGHAIKIGCRKVRRARRPADWEEAVRRMHAEGCHDSEVGAALKMSKANAGYLRKKLGLLPNDSNARLRQIKRDHMLRIHRERRHLGVSVFGSLIRRKHDDYAASLGWPHLPRRGTMILEVLWVEPLLTATEIRERMGLPYRRTGLTCGASRAGGTLTSLQQMGLVLQSPRVKPYTRKSKIRGMSPVYCLSPLAIQLKSKFLARKNDEPQRSVDQDCQPAGRAAAIARPVDAHR